MLEGFDKRKACPACNGTSSSPIYEETYDSKVMQDYLSTFYEGQGEVNAEVLFGHSYALQKCGNCGLVYQEYIPNEALMATLYEEWLDPHKIFDKYEQSHPVSYYQGLADEVNSLLNYFGKLPAELKFFDFGLGWSNWLKMVQGFGIKAEGTELSETRIAHARKFGIPIITWDEIPDQSYDFINTEQVFEHIPEPLETLKHLKKALKPGGMIKVSVPNGFDIERRLEVNNWSAPKGSADSLNPVAPLEHINCFKRSTIIKMGEVAGLKEIPFEVNRSLFPEAQSSGSDKMKAAVRPLYRMVKPNPYPFAPTYIMLGHG